MPFASQIYYTEFKGTQNPKPPVILIHGAGSNHLCWPAELRRLRGEHVLSIDLPGHGRSPGNAHHSIQAYSRAVLEFLAAVGWFQAVFIGHSMGGAVALQLARDHGEHVAAVGLIASAASFDLDEHFCEQFHSPSTLPQALKSLEKMMFSPQTSPQVAARLQKSLTRSRPSLWYADWRACRSFDLRADLPVIHKPVFIAAGGEDGFVRFQSSQYLANMLPDAQLEPFYPNGHLLMLEEPQHLSQKLKDFLVSSKL